MKTVDLTKQKNDQKPDNFKDFLYNKKGYKHNTDEEMKKNNTESKEEIKETKNEIKDHKIINKTKDGNKENKKVKKENINSKYITRDLSWIKFDYRILSLAKDKSIPLFERLKFLAISASNLDEFSMVRIPKLIENKDDINIMKRSKLNELKTIYKEIDKFTDKQDEVASYLLNELYDTCKIKMINDTEELDTAEKHWCKKYFKSHIKSLITPIVIDNSRPFPLVLNGNIYIGVIIKDKETDKNIFGTLALPNIDRLIKIKSSNPEIKKYILLEDLIILNLNQIFEGMKISKICKYRVIRNFDYKISNDIFITDQLKSTLKRRETNDVVRLNISGNKKEFINILNNALNINKYSINKTKGFIDLKFFFKLGSLGYGDYQYKEFIPNMPSYNKGILNAVEDGDILLHHPYDSYQQVLDFIEQACTDKDVVAIKQTIYRVTKDSPIMHSLLKAAQSGKSVTVLFEVKARFDEANNIEWANRLENAGANIIYGVPGLKTHCKLCMIVKKNKKGDLIKLCHIGTGNYNENNPYTDLSYFTAKEKITDEVESVFNYLTGYSKLNLKHLMYSPSTLCDGICNLIDKEIQLKKEGNNKTKIFLKVNGLTCKNIIDKLYEARDAGIPITLVVRSACSLVDTRGITVKSIVGRFLEHSRIYSFSGCDKIYISSADMMERNLYHRVEVAVKITNKAKDKLKSIIDVYENDTDCFYLQEDGTYKYPSNRDTNTNSQSIFMNINNNTNEEYVISNKIHTMNKKQG